MKFLLPCLLAMPLFGETVFSDFREIYTSNPVANFRSADVNADGRLDLIINGSRFAELYLNSPAGFGLPSTVTNGFVETFGDLDGDGDVDALATYRVSPTSFNRRISWLANDGSGSFSPSENVVINSIDATLMPPVDLDNDGDLDVIVATFRNYRWMENTGDGFGFSLSVLPDDFFRPATGSFVDLNNDGLPDLIATSESGGSRSVVVHFQLAPEEDGTRNFSSATEVAATPFTLEAVGDFNADDQPDFLAIDINGPANFFYGVNDGTFTAGPNIPEPISRPGLTPIDWDGDGDTDLLGRNFSPESESYFLENDNGTFATSVEFNAITSDFEEFLVDDFFGDSRADFIIIREPDQVVATEQTSPNTFQTPTVLKDSLGRIGQIEIASLDSDGRPDFLFGNSTNINSQIRSVGARGFSAFEEIANSSSGDDSFQFLVGDFDGTNGDDLIQRNSDNGEMRLFKNDGAGGFESPVTIATQSGNLATFVTGDFNADGRLDFIVVTGPDVRLYQQDATAQSFTSSALSGTFGTIRTVHAVDADGDTDLDLVAGSLVGVDGAAFLFTNDGSGNFAPASKLLDLDDAPSFIRMADVDGAEGLDLVVLDNFGVASNLDLFLASGAGFGAKTEVFAGSASSWRCELGDLDNDGDPDLAVVGSAGNNNIKIYWFENEAGVFSSAKTISNQLGIKWSRVIISDLDQDGDQDLVVAGTSAGVVRWIENQLGEDPLTRWAKPQGIENTEPRSDDDEDGIPLFVEFAYNLDPTAAGDRGLPTLKIYPDGSRIRADYEYLRRNDAAEVGLTYTFEVSETMAEESWITKSLSTSGTNLGNGYLRVNRTRSTVQNGRRDRFFGRFGVTYDPPAE